MTYVTFVDDFLVKVAVAEARPPSDEYETDSEDDFTDRKDEDIAPITVSTEIRAANTRPFPPGFVRYMDVCLQ